MASGISARLSRSEGRRFGLTVGGAFLALTALLWWRDHMLIAAVTGAIAGLLLIAGLTIPSYLGPIEAAWMGLARAVSKVTTPIVMGVVYYLVLTPVGLIMRLFGRNPLVKKQQDGEAGVWLTRDESRRPRTDMEHQF